MISIAYMTNRRNPRLHWFLDSLFLQWRESQIPITLIIVDFYADDPRRREKFAKAAGQFIAAGVILKHVEPLPNVWQGKYRLTQKDYFNAANSRNTAICHAPDGSIVFVDDVSVILPGWLSEVSKSIQEGWIACGAYSKVRNLIVEGGVVQSFDGLPGGFSPAEPFSDQLVKLPDEFQSGIDHRLKYAHKSQDPFPCNGKWLFGCSFTAPVEILLKVNGLDTESTPQGGEDYILGMYLEKHKQALYYCKRMLTLESEEAHGEDEPFARLIKPGKEGRKDSSWAMLAAAGTRKVSPNYELGPGGLRGLRDRILAGEMPPVVQEPRTDWFDGQELVTM